MYDIVLFLIKRNKNIDILYLEKRNTKNIIKVFRH